ncbi:unnamed protein product [Penicillium olsonii]|uniref:Major facilitator superfamily (MFS) profile domain-containing protein n=1 Tax=Penicillium olsonii TaxID=99116 RepID=A0A9W4I0T2_PENOL|nr:unnamed protein product [Penicillium olsonii]CAG8208603.1 unnamed protein product [Penicillium olsonii]
MVALENAAIGDISISYGPAGIKGLIRSPYIFSQALFASIGGFLYGYDQGVISGILVMSSFGKQFPTLADDATLQGWMVSILTLGAMFGAFVNGPIADRFSRRWSIFYANIIFLIGSAIQAGAQDLPMIFISRFITGVSIGMLSMVVPLYLSEVAPPELRGSLVALQQLAITCGIMCAFWLDYGTQYIGGTGDGQSEAAWRFPLAFQCFPSLLLAAGTFFLPYSPRWLVQADREQEARDVLCRLRRVPESDPRIRLELLEIKAASLFEQETRAAKYPDVRKKVQVALREYKDLFVLPHLNRRLLIACMLQFIQQFTGGLNDRDRTLEWLSLMRTGINAVIYYAPIMFRSIGLKGDSISLLATGVVGIINFVFTIPTIMFIDKWGRRKILLMGAVGMGTSQLIVGTLYAVYRDRWETNVGAGWAAAVFIWIYIANFAYSIGCVNWIMPSEIFPPCVRSKGVSIAIGTNWLTNFIVALITPRMLESITFGTFYFFLAFCVILFVWVIFLVPETKGVPIEEMDQLFGGNQGQEDLTRMLSVRARLGFADEGTTAKKNIEEDHATVEERE